ncbi:ABC transporter ATP-binding protein [Rhodococcus qingshengii]|uniref:ABC transporter ATP-binding protein n=1 Tax=Rhodococcus qingshengii TaxID=334542 RepID=UPI0021BA81D7|nr:ABC transporter ATP-binding protein [Rhodococcus qingshengii]UXF65952.1 ABC transporter ATP-binding protein [Rhodococcus qingshengii]
MSLLSVDDLHAGYGRGNVLHGVSLDVEPGGVAVVLGANGAGKTTMMRALAGLIPHQGTITFNGSPLGSKPERAVAAGVSLVPQGRGTLGQLSVRDNLLVGTALRNDKAEIEADIERWCETFPVLARRSTQLAGSLSGGEQQMLAVARALMSRPTLLLCDEPSLGLAPIVIAELFDTLGAINRSDGTALLIVEQNADLAMKLASKVFLLDVGTIVAAGTPEEFRSDDVVRSAYLGYQE